jgi:subtilisin family serine protease
MTMRIRFADFRIAGPFWRACRSLARLWKCGWVFCVAFSSLAAGPVLSFHPTRILLQPLAGVRLADLEKFHAAQGFRVLRQFARFGNIQVLQVPPGLSVAQALARYQRSGWVKYAEPDYQVFPALTPNEPAFADGTLWHLSNTGQNGGLAGADIHAAAGWDLQNTASNVIVAIVDTGVRYTHQDLASNMWINPAVTASNGVNYLHGADLADGTGDPIDLIGHGTEVAGVVGAVGNNGVGTVGVAWKIQIMACRYTTDTGQGFTSDIVASIDYALTNGANIINASFTSSGYSQAMYDAINRCRSAGLIVVAAAGNFSSDNDVSPCYPAGYDLDNVVAVAATTSTDALAYYSDYGAATVGLAAPGTDIFTTLNSSDSSYGAVSGTSFAAPITAGAIALLEAHYPAENYRQILNRLYAGVDPLPSLAGKCVTGGRLDLSQALAPTVISDFTPSVPAGAVPLTVFFTNFACGSITNWNWDFGDGTPSSVPNPSHTFYWQSNFAVSLTVTDNTGRSSTKTETIAAIGNYRITPGAFQWIDPAAMPLVALNCAVVSPPQALPFPFNFYGSNYNQVYIGAAGLIGFDGLDFYNDNTDLPNPAPPHNIICPLWDAWLDPCQGGAVYFGTVGSAPNRKAVISWVSVPSSLYPGDTFTFQVWLEEATQQIQFQYLNAQPGSQNGDAGGAFATIGVEHSSGLAASQYSYAGSLLLTNGQAILFIPTSSDAYRYPPAVSVLGFQPDTANLQLSVQGVPGGSYILQASGDLTAWTPVATNSPSATNGSVIFTDPQAGQFGRRFYRAAVVP